MSVERRHIVFLGFGAEDQPALQPHNLTILPPGVASLSAYGDIFDADLVVFAPSPALLAPPLEFQAAMDLVATMAYEEIVPHRLIHFLDDSPSRDYVSKKAAALVAERARPSRKSKTLSKAAQRRTGKRAAKKKSRSAVSTRLSQQAAVLKSLVACGTWLLRSSFGKGQSGPQDVIIFVPSAGMKDGAIIGPYEPHCTGALMENWLGLRHCNTFAPINIVSQSLKWTPYARALGWPAWMKLDSLMRSQQSVDLPFMQVGPHGDLFRRGADICGDESVRDLRVTLPGESVVKCPGAVQWTPLVSSSDGMHIVGGVYEVNDLRIHLVPAPPDPAVVVAQFVAARYGIETSGSVQTASKRSKPIQSIRINPCSPQVSFSPKTKQPGDKRGMGWNLLVNEEYQIGLGETKFLQLLAFIAADRAGQTAGIDPTDPKIGTKVIKHVFRPCDGYRGKFARRVGKSDRMGKQRNPALPASGINEFFTKTLRELEILSRDDTIKLICQVEGKIRRYAINPDLSACLHVEIPSPSAPDPTAKALLALVDRNLWDPVRPPSRTDSKHWYQKHPEQVAPNICI